MRLETSDIAKAFPGWLALWLGLLGGSASALADAPGDRAVQDARIHGRLEATFALNSYLSPFDIRTSVAGGVVRLSGTVGSDIDRDLALAIAQALDGVSDVQSSLTVDPDSKPTVHEAIDDETPSFRQRVNDATSTARVRSNLQSNGNTQALSIDVGTENDVVTLKGTVPSRKEKMLAEMIARNTDGIANVRNLLETNEQQ